VNAGEQIVAVVDLFSTVRESVAQPNGTSVDAPPISVPVQIQDSPQALVDQGVAVVVEAVANLGNKRVDAGRIVVAIAPTISVSRWTEVAAPIVRPTVPVLVSLTESGQIAVLVVARCITDLYIAGIAVGVPIIAVVAICTAKMTVSIAVLVASRTGTTVITDFVAGTDPATVERPLEEMSTPELVGIR
jgi:hypothetical protein